jgi:PilZ domain
MMATALGTIQHTHDASDVEPIMEQRRAQRRLERTGGLIKVRGYRISVPCCIENTSATGACITITAGKTLEDSAHLPDSIVLSFVRELVEIECQIIWRENTRFGVEFTSCFRRAM